MKSVFDKFKYVDGLEWTGLTLPPVIFSLIVSYAEF